MYLQCCKASHPPILLSNGVPVIIGRSAETKISDKLCSRNQLQLESNYNKKFVIVKQLGQNPSQIEGIDIGHRKSDILSPGQTLYIIDMKYPHKVVYTGPNSSSQVSSQTEVDNKAELNEEKNVKRKSMGENTDEKKTKQQKVGKICSSIDKCTNNDKTSSNSEQSVAKTKENAKISSSKPVHWAQGLKASMSDPDLQVYNDAQVTVIKDKYPKAKYHWLVMPVEAITTTSQLRSTHIPLLKHMLKIGKQMHEEHVNAQDKKKLKFRYGYHAVPSMSHLHMHVISQDFCSPALKTKKHWNSFTTSYFVDAEVLINEVEENGKVENRKHMSELLNNPLCCHVCGKNQKNMPALKKHILHCS